MRICLLGPNPKEKGGVAKSTLYLAYIYKKILGYNVVWFSSNDVKRADLSKCDIIHSQGPLYFIAMVKLILSRKPKKILTLRGWVLDEAKTFVLGSHNAKEKLRNLLVYILNAINWIMHKLILIPFVYDYVTAVSHITAKKNGVNALVIPNPTICRDSGFPRDYSNHTPKEVLLVTYVSIGGGKVLSIPRLIKTVKLLNKKLESPSINKRVILHIYGKDVPPNIIEAISRIQYVKFLGYVNDYLDRLREADLFLAGYTFPELGHAALEAICAGAPIAKFTEDPKLEEIKDGFNGVLASSDEEMVEKLVNYVLNMNEERRKLLINARDTILKVRNICRVAVMWKTIIRATDCSSRKYKLNMKI
uniref:Glycosyltransferase family 1 protein n=1 Tax=Ignisphaera aggregans TaxID=334771 RepID=A0A7J3YUL9_9CREN